MEAFFSNQFAIPLNASKFALADRSTINSTAEKAFVTFRYLASVSQGNS